MTTGVGDVSTVPVRPEAGLLSPAMSASGPERHLCTAALRADLGPRSARSALVTLAAQALVVTIGVSSTAVLARLLTPYDFGLIAIVATLTGFVGTFRDGGLAYAAVQHERVSHAQASELFWINVRYSLLVALFTAAMAPVLAWFFREPPLLGMTLAVTAGVLAAGLSSLHVGLLRRQMRFGALTWIEVGATLAGAAAGIAAAAAGAGYWALAIQQLATMLAQSVGLWTTCRWRPGRYDPSAASDDHDAVRSMRANGIDLSRARVVQYVGHHVDRLLLGRFGDAVQVGLYQNAIRWSSFPVQQLYYPLAGVVVASLSRVQDDVPRYRAYFRTILTAIFCFSLPATAFACVEAREMILLLLGRKWVEAVPYFQILSVSAFAGSPALVARWVYLSEGLVRRYLRWTLTATPVVVLAMIVGVRWGALGLACGYAAVVCLLAYPAVRYCMAGSKLTPRDVWAPFARSAIPAAAGAAALLALRAFTGPTGNDDIGARDALATLARHGCLFAAAYVTARLALPGGRDDLAGLLRLAGDLRRLLVGRGAAQA